MRILIIPEDFRKDQYMLKPIFDRLFRSIGKPNRTNSGVPGPEARRHR